MALSLGRNNNDARYKENRQALRERANSVISAGQDAALHESMKLKGIGDLPANHEDDVRDSTSDTVSAVVEQVLSRLNALTPYDHAKSKFAMRNIVGNKKLQQHLKGKPKHIPSVLRMNGYALDRQVYRDTVVSVSSLNISVLNAVVAHELVKDAFDKIGEDFWRSPEHSIPSFSPDQHVLSFFATFHSNHNLIVLNNYDTGQSTISLHSIISEDIVGRVNMLSLNAFWKKYPNSDVTYWVGYHEHYDFPRDDLFHVLKDFS